MQIDVEKMGSLLAANWTKFTDARAMIRAVAKHSGVSHPVTSVVVSRFELTPEGFLVWAEFVAGPVHGTSEFVLSNTGELTHRRTV
jgi:hypothetical protein